MPPFRKIDLQSMDNPLIDSMNLRVRFQNPSGKGWNSTVLPFYSGQIVISGDNEEQLSMPYFGKGLSTEINTVPC